MRQAADINAFLAGVEKRAFNMARFAVRNTEDALDIVQDTMLTLVRRYADKPRDEWQPLFYRILQSRIADHHRRSTLRRRWFGWLTSDGTQESDDALNEAADPGMTDPSELAAMDGTVTALDRALEALPLRQQQSFLLRTVEGLSVADTAAVMGCSEGSVKTHHFRALATLREQLQDYWI
ncbi:MAG: RNA polymerase sigma factor [Pseudomonadales bacterium]|nr:RNA polymerase sigma factor [Pseudomonadales bacterium]